MKVVLLNTSDAKGGAAVVSRRLMHALVGAGVDARMLVVDRYSDDARVAVAGTAEERRMAFLRERLGIFLHNGLSRKQLFKVSTARYGVDVLSHPWLRDAEVVCLNWINQGMMSLGDIGRLGAMGKKVVWTMHDMWCATGICHHAYDCDGYEGRCGRCKFLHSHRSRDLSARVWERKRDVYDKTPIHFVAVSRWLAECCRRSGLLADSRLTVIPNTMHIEREAPVTRLGDATKKVITMGAARLDDPVKGFELLIDACRKIAATGRRDIVLQLFGTLRDTTLLEKIAIPCQWVGPVSQGRVAELMRHSDAVVSSSHFETFGATLVEGLANGCMAVSFDHGGQGDIITHRRNGYLAAYPDTDDLARGMLWSVDHPMARETLRDDAATRFSEESVARAYIELFEQLLKDK